MQNQNSLINNVFNPIKNILIIWINNCNKNPEIGATSGFLLGFFTNVYIRRKIIKKPFTTIYEGVISGIMCCIGGSCLVTLMPEPFIFLLPTTTILSIICYNLKGIRNIWKKRNRLY